MKLFKNNRHDNPSVPDESKRRGANKNNRATAQKNGDATFILHI